MSDATEAVREAITLNKRLAAKHLVRKQELEAEVAKLQRDRADAEADPALAVAFDGKLADATTQLLATTHDYNAALAELAALDKLGGQAQTANAKTIAASIHGDPLIRSAEQVALDNVRERGADLDADQKLAEELGERAPAAAAAPSRGAAPSREAADAVARREFEALRAKQQAPATEQPPAPAAAPPPDAAPQGPPKKTL